MHGCQNFCSLFDLVVVVMLIFVQLQAEKQHHAMSNASLQCDDFDFELLILYYRMACLVVKKFVPFLELCKIFFTTKLHNMLVAIGSPLQMIVVFSIIYWSKEFLNSGVMTRSLFFHSS
jgi:hypothetical protein